MCGQVCAHLHINYIYIYILYRKFIIEYNRAMLCGVAKCDAVLCGVPSFVASTLG